MLNSQETTLVGIDLQEKLVNMLKDDKISKNISNLLKAAAILNITTILTEQYPKGLGKTFFSLSDINNMQIIEKTSFSAYKTKDFVSKLENANNKTVLIFGIETHICVYQTVIDLIKNGYNVSIISDCCFSRNQYNHNIALNLLENLGAKITTLEIALFEFLEDSKHPKFKEIQSLIK